MEDKRELFFFSTKKCYTCGYDIEANMPESWEVQTGCPKCNKSFVD